MISENGFILTRFHCACDKGWRGSQCEVCCDLPCENQGSCYRDDNSEPMYCICPAGYQGEYCELAVHEGTTNAMNQKTASKSTIVSTSSSSSGAPTSSTTRDRKDSPSPCNDRPEPIVCIPNFLTCYHGTCFAKEVDEKDAGIIGTHVACDCFDGWRGSDCNECCTLPCVEGTCYNYDSGEMYCICFRDWTGDLCEVPITTTVESKDVTKSYTRNHGQDWMWWPIIVGLGVLIILLILLFAVIYILYRHRCILIMKLVFYFQSTKDEEDNKIFDAFVSFHPSQEDEAFVQQLKAKLEQEMRFHLFLHRSVSQDEKLGTPEADRAVSAMENSSRIILVISPDYLDSEWPRMERQLLAAWQDLLPVRGRIIPILFKDISEHKATMDKNLKYIMSSATLEWPGTADQKREAKFWKTLQLVMPKRKTPPKEKQYGVDFAGRSGVQNAYEDLVNGVEGREDNMNTSDSEDKQRKQELYVKGCSGEILV